MSSLTRLRRPSWAWVGVVPFLAFTLMFLILPTSFLAIEGFRDPEGRFTAQNILNLFKPNVLRAYSISIQISAASAIGGGIIGSLLAYAVTGGELPRWVRPALMTFSGVASNFAGVPLSFAFLATVGRTGLVTIMLANLFGFNLYSTGFNLLSFSGLTLTYMYFQIPLMVLIIAPAFDGLKREWREASANLGATPWQYWRYIGLPILWPPLLGSTLLLFANAFGAVATAYALTGGLINIVTILLYAQIRGDVLHDPHLGYAIAVGMIAITGLSNAIYVWLRGRSERWLR